MLIDTHCHIHESQYYTDDRETVYARAIASDIAMICVGTSQTSSTEAVQFVAAHDETWAIIGVHPHESTEGTDKIAQLLAQKPAKLIGIGEIGLDYFYDNAPREAQIDALEAQLQLARDYDLPVSFHVRGGSDVAHDAFSDFWPILANFSGTRGVLHSFTDTTKNFEKALENDLFIGVNGISTFAKNNEMWQHIPLEKMLLETDAPFLTPIPLRGKVNEPAFVGNVAEFHASARGLKLEHLARVTSANARELFSI